MDKKLLDKLNGFNLSMQQKMQLVELIQEAGGGASNGGGANIVEFEYYRKQINVNNYDTGIILEGVDYKVVNNQIYSKELYSKLYNHVIKNSSFKCVSDIIIAYPCTIALYFLELYNIIHINIIVESNILTIAIADTDEVV